MKISLSRNVAFWAVAFCLYSPAVLARGRGCGPEGCSTGIAILTTGALIYWAYRIFENKKPDWRKGIRHIIAILIIASLGVDARGTEAAFVAFLIMLITIHCLYIILQNEKSKE